MKTLFQILLCGSFLYSCEKKDDVQSDFSARIRNNSEYTISNISLFSLPYNDLKAGETSQYQTVNINHEKDDPMIYLTIENISVGKYLIPESTGKFTYIIDSVQLQDQSIFISKIKE